MRIFAPYHLENLKKKFKKFFEAAGALVIDPYYDCCPSFRKPLKSVTYAAFFFSRLLIYFVKIISNRFRLKQALGGKVFDLEML